MKINWKQLLILLAIPLAVGGLGTLLSGGMDRYKIMNQPPLSPPGWVFPVVWTILYLLMGYASYLVYTSGRPQEEIRKAEAEAAFERKAVEAQTAARMKVISGSEKI